MKKKILALCLVVALAATAVIGGTLAYFTDADKDVNVMTVGSVTIRQDEWQRDDKGKLEVYTDAEDAPLLPAVYYDANGEVVVKTDGRITSNEIISEETPYTVDGLNDTFLMPSNIKNMKDKIVTVTNTGENDVYVRTIIMLEAGDSVTDDYMSTLVDQVYTNGTNGSSWYRVKANGQDDLVTIDGKQYTAWVYTYGKALAKGETAYPTLMGVWMKSNTTSQDMVNWTPGTILTLSQGVQADGFNTAADAFAAAFDGADGVVSASEIAGWWDAVQTK